MFIPNVFNVFFLVLVLFDVLDVGLSADLGIDSSDPLGLSDPDPSDPSCLLTINATSLNEKVSLEEDDDYMKRWAESYLKESATNAARDLIGEFIQTMLKGILGSIVKTLFQAFWPSSTPSKEESLLDIVFAWTKEYVSTQLARLVRSLAEGDLATAKDGLGLYRNASEKLVERAAEEEKKWFGRFPIARWLDAKSTLDTAMAFADSSRNKLTPTSTQSNETKVAGIPTYMASVTLSMTMWRELYDLTVFKETWPHCNGEITRLGVFRSSGRWRRQRCRRSRRWRRNTTDPAGYYTSKGIITEMEKKWETINKEAAGLIEIWRSWRIREGDPTPRVWVKEEWCEPKGTWASAGYRIEDQKLGQGWTFGVYQGTKEQRHCPDPNFEEFTSLLHKMYERKLFVEEVVPLFKPYTNLQRLIPGREKKKLKPSLLPEKVIFGPFSYWLTRTSYLSSVDYDHANVNKEVHIYGTTYSIWERTIATKGISQLNLRTGGFVLQFPSKGEGDSHKAKYVPKKTCGLDVVYTKAGASKFMTQFAAINAKNQSEVWRPEKRDKSWQQSGFMATGRGLCGVYKFGRMSKILRDADSTRQPFEIEFQWDDDPDAE